MATGRERGDRHGDFRFRPGEMPPLFGDTAALLIVDDDKHVANILTMTLEPEGYKCTVATDGTGARARLAEKDFAIALIDVMMPGESGLELVEDLVGKYPELAVVMVTGVDDPNIADLALESGAYGYIVKPFRTSEMLITVANAGRRRCLEIERRAQREHVERLLADRTAELGDMRDQLKQGIDEP